MLPCGWSCVMVFLSFLSYAAPQAIRLAFPQFRIRGVVGAFSNLCFVGHLMMLSNTASSSAQRLSAGHLAVQVVGSTCAFGADVQSMRLTVFLALDHLLSIGGTIFELWLWTRVLQPTLASRNPKLVSELPMTVFRWLFQRGGLMMGGYCYFEALGEGFSIRSAEDIAPWLHANSAILQHSTFSAVLSLTILADSHVSLSAVLRGMAPLHVRTGLVIVLVTSTIPLTMDADRQQRSFYSAASTSFYLLWAIAVGILAAGYTSHDSATKVPSLAVSLKATPVGGSSCGGEYKDDPGGAPRPIGRQERGLSLSTVTGGAVLATGI